MTIDVMISTLNDRIYNISNIVLEPTIGINYIICHQITEDKIYKISYENRTDIKYIQIKNKGLSLSRNTCIENSSADILLIADDDIIYEKNFSEVLKSSFLRYSDADVLCFKTKIVDTDLPFKEYPSKVLKIDNVRKYAPASIEIAIRRDSLYKIGKFNTLFGVGSLFPVGEETILIAEAIKNNCNILFIPEYIVSHPQDSTGTNRFSNKNIIVAVGAYYSHLYGKKMAYLLSIRNAIFNFKKYKLHFSFFVYIRFLFEGIHSYLIKKGISN